MTDHTAAVFAALSDRYEITSELGRGGMATVYRARDLRHGSEVAIKILRPELVQALGGERFTREVRVTAGLQHPHVLPLLDSGEADGLPFYVMPFVEGASLAQRLELGGPLPIIDAVQYIAEIADGLSHAHTRGLIHRDIKPANILLSNGHALLADFGIARVLDVSGTQSLTDSGLALGTAGYMSPEQAAGERVDARSDIYALGCVLYELLAGTPPFTGSSQRAIMARHAVDPVPSVRTVRREVSPALESVIVRALAKVPADRFATAAEFRDAVRAAGTGTGAVAATSPMRRATTRWIWTAVAGAIVLIASLLLWPHGQETSAPLSANRVMVFPLLVPADWSGARTAGEDVSTMIGSAMDGAGSLRWVDGWQLLAPTRRDDMRSLADSEANALARSQHCRYVVTGRLLSRSSDSAEVLLSLRDLQTDSVLSRPRGVSSAREAWRAGLRAVGAMLPTIIPGSGAELTREWVDRDPQAVASFLAGEAAFRRLQLDDALTQYKAAVRADSSFGFAALRGAQVASWAHKTSDAVSFAQTARAHVRLPRDRAFADGLSAYLDGNADSAITALRSAIAIDPEMIVAWMQLGETYEHLLPTSGRTSVLADEALRRAWSIDSSATPLLFHQVELAARAGDRMRADSMARRFTATARDTMLKREVELIAGCVNGRWTTASTREDAAVRPNPLLIATKLLGLTNVQCMRAGYDALVDIDTSTSDADADPRRWFAMMGVHHLQLARGHADSAIAEIDRFYARWHIGSSLFLVDAPAVPAFADRARKVVVEDSTRYGVDFRDLQFPTRMWAHGIWAATDGRLATAQALATRLQARSTRAGQPRDTLRMDSARADAVLAHLTLARGDTADAIQRLFALLHRAVPPTAISWEDEMAFGFQRLTLGRLLVARRRFAEARGVLEVLESTQPIGFPLYLPESLRLRAQAAEAMGDAAEASTIRQRLEFRAP